MTDGTSEGPIAPNRFEVELEFIQCLANPQYVNYLAQNNYLEDEKFIEYLKYLEYWRDPQYAKFIVYPNCLHMLTLLQQPSFRREITRTDLAKLIMDDYYMSWLSTEHGEPNGVNGPAVPGTSADATNNTSTNTGTNANAAHVAIKQE